MPHGSGPTEPTRAALLRAAARRISSLRRRPASRRACSALLASVAPSAAVGFVSGASASSVVVRAPYRRCTASSSKVGTPRHRVYSRRTRSACSRVGAVPSSRSSSTSYVHHSKPPSLTCRPAGPRADEDASTPVPVRAASRAARTAAAPLEADSARAAAAGALGLAASCSTSAVAAAATAAAAAAASIRSSSPPSSGRRPGASRRATCRT